MGAVREKSKGLSWSWQILKRRRAPTDPFFEDGDLVCCLANKQLPLEEQEDLFYHRLPEFVCSIARCSKSFDNLLRYEAHYNSNHRNSCGSCGRCFPSNHLLELHILETHDSMFEVLAAKQSMFQCLVEECHEMFPSPVQRKNHVVKIHHYPANFRFHRQKKTGPKYRSVQPAKVPGDREEPMESESVSPSNIDRPPLMTAQPVSHQGQPKRVFSYNVPKSITFGQGVSRGFHRRGRGRGSHGKASHWHQKAAGMIGMDTTVDIEAVNMDDLASALTT